MPQIVADMAASTGDTVEWEMEAPGGAYLLQHVAFNPPTITKIMKGGWDYVVVQEQSLNPAQPDTFVNKSLFPYARRLDSIIHEHNKCAETIFYMTWGRKNGDSVLCEKYTLKYNWPHYCTYGSMDSMLRYRYQQMADSNNGVVAPAGSVWRYIRAKYPSIELYDADESHPSKAGSYAVACAMYTAMFRKDPALIPYNYSLSSAEAANIKTAASKVTYDSMLYWHIGEYKNTAGFSYTATGTSIAFADASVNADTYLWIFGDGQTSTMQSPIHNYTTPGTYYVSLVTTDTTKQCSDTSYAVLNAFPQSILRNMVQEPDVSIHPNPANDILNIDVLKLNNVQRYKAVIADMMGSVVLNAPIETGSNQLDISKLSPALYIVKIYADGRLLSVTPTVKNR